MAEFFSMQKSKWPYTLLLNLIFLFLISCLTVNLHSSSSEILWPDSNPTANDFKKMGTDIGCKGIQSTQNKQEKCSYAKSHESCKPRGYIPYLQLFYCTFSPYFGYVSLALWLVLLFYLLGDTASNYFCYSLVGLSKTLKLSPAIAGVTLLSLGNGAPDVFASIISFTGDGTTDIGLSSILGGAFFVSCVVVGIISISVTEKINRPSFIKNVVFLLLSLSVLLLIIILGKVSLWGALSFLAIYLVYVFFVFALETCFKDKNGVESSDMYQDQDRSHDLEAVFLCSTDHQVDPRTDDRNKILSILELPLHLPRMLTIPVVSEERWSKPIAVMSATFSPIALSITTKSSFQTVRISVAVGILCGILAFCTTEKSHPPNKCLLLWIGLGFVMSITWTYVLAQELISLLVSMGLILGLNYSILGLTVLAWGNSVGDLVENMTMAKRCGPEGAQTAVSGSYAGPIFNIFVGLGLSLTFSAWTTYPDSYVVSVDHSVFLTIGFFIVGLVWALVMVLKRKMRIDKWLGSGLVAIYFCFLFFQMAIKL